MLLFFSFILLDRKEQSQRSSTREVRAQKSVERDGLFWNLPSFLGGYHYTARVVAAFRREPFHAERKLKTLRVSLLALGLPLLASQQVIFAFPFPSSFLSLLF